MDKNQASWYIGSEFFRVSCFCLFLFHAYSNDEFAGASVARRASPLSAMPSKTSIITIFSPSEKSSIPRSLLSVAIWPLLIDILVYQSFSASVMCPCEYKRIFKTSIYSCLESSIQLTLKWLPPMTHLPIIGRIFPTSAVVFGSTVMYKKLSVPCSKDRKWLDAT